ncbi:acyltransferase family protein [Actinoplanes sp. HUAS TT8]|uniref:acyltransferase family protein n=1 Tax=Actinoplanes sp. HUAS TT8 TaxID=3447453 RepID=UPI003F527A89
MTPTGRDRIAGLTAATPAGRDRTVDALRAVAILGVILGHWLVSALVSDPDQPSAWHGASPLEHYRALTPATWLLQTLGLFFFAAGFAASRSPGRRVARPRLTSRIGRLVKPVTILAAVWLAALGLLAAAGAPESTRDAVRSLVTHPMWFLIVYVVLLAAARPLRAAVIRFGLRASLVPVVLIALADVVRHLGVDSPVLLLAAPVGWAAPYMWGIAFSEGLLTRRHGPVLAAAGVVTGLLLVVGVGYPASAVGVPGDGWSNLDPPSLFALALAAAQLGGFLMVRPRLEVWLRRPELWRPVVTLNRFAMTLFCWHQTALLLVCFASLPTGPRPGLLDAPEGMWPVHRLFWLPVFALVLAVLCAIFQPTGSSGATSNEPIGVRGSEPVELTDSGPIGVRGSGPVELTGNEPVALTGGGPGGETDGPAGVETPTGPVRTGGISA